MKLWNNRLTNSTCCKCGQIFITGNTNSNSDGTSAGPDQKIPAQPYNPPTMVKQTVTALYAV